MEAAFYAVRIAHQLHCSFSIPHSAVRMLKAHRPVGLLQAYHVVVALATLKEKVAVEMLSTIILTVKVSAPRACFGAYRVSKVVALQPTTPVLILSVPVSLSPLPRNCWTTTEAFASPRTPRCPAQG